MGKRPNVQPESKQEQAESAEQNEVICRRLLGHSEPTTMLSGPGEDYEMIWGDLAETEWTDVMMDAIEAESDFETVVVNALIDEQIPGWSDARVFDDKSAMVLLRATGKAKRRAVFLALKSIGSGPSAKM